MLIASYTNSLRPLPRCDVGLSGLFGFVLCLGFADNKTFVSALEVCSWLLIAKEPSTKVVAKSEMTTRIAIVYF
jgi:hypothetical protein